MTCFFFLYIAIMFTYANIHNIRINIIKSVSDDDQNYYILDKNLNSVTAHVATVTVKSYHNICVLLENA